MQSPDKPTTRGRGGDALEFSAEHGLVRHATYVLNTTHVPSTAYGLAPWVYRDFAPGQRTWISDFIRRQLQQSRPDPGA